MSDCMTNLVVRIASVSCPFMRDFKTETRVMCAPAVHARQRMQRPQARPQRGGLGVADGPAAQLPAWRPRSFAALITAPAVRRLWLLPLEGLQPAAAPAMVQRRRHSLHVCVAMVTDSLLVFKISCLRDIADSLTSMQSACAAVSKSF